MEKEKQKAEHPSIIEIKKFMDLLIIGNYDELKNLIDKKDFEFIKIILRGTEKMRYRLNSIKYNNKKAIINITVKQPDLSTVNDKAAENFEKEDIDYDILTAEEKEKVIKRILGKTVQEELESDNLEYFKKTLDLTYIKIGENWILETENKDEFFDIFMSKIKQEPYMTYKEREELEKQWLEAAEKRDIKTLMSIAEKFIEEYPNEEYLYEYLGTFYMAENDPERAEQYLLKAVELGDKDTALITLAAIYAEQGDTEKAEETLKKTDEKFSNTPMDIITIIRDQKTIAIFLDDFNAQWFLADFYMTHLKNNKEAKKWAEKALESSRKMPESVIEYYIEKLEQIDEILKIS